jgi:hypothetical protein
MDPSPRRPPFDKLPIPFAVLSLVISILDELAIPHMVAGSFASSLYGPSRYTQDADLVLDLKPEQIKDFTARFSPEFYVDPTAVEQAVAGRSSFNIIHIATSFKVDCFILKYEPFEEECFGRRQFRTIDPETGLGAYTQSPEDTILQKLAWYQLSGRNLQTQWGDVQGVLKSRDQILDWAYLHRWASQLGLADLLDKAIGEARLPEAGQDK